MGIFKIYKMELYKMIHRKNTWILFIPSLLGILIAAGVGSGAVKITNTSGGTTKLLSCLDFISFQWTFLYEIGILGILIVLLAAFTFSGEIEGGQIKLQLLRVGSRDKLLISKLLALTSFILLAVFAFIVIVSISYYLFIAKTPYGNGTFGLSKEIGFTYSGFLLSLMGNCFTFVILSSITFLIGQRLNTFSTFICTLLLMYVSKYLSSLEAFTLRKYLISYMSNEFLTNSAIKVQDMFTFIGCTLLYIGVIMITAFTLFSRRDIK